MNVASLLLLEVLAQLSSLNLGRSRLGKGSVQGSKKLVKYPLTYVTGTQQ